MLSEQNNRPILRKSVSFAGITKHSRTTRRLRNRRFKHQTSESPSLLKDNPHFYSHPYKAQKENMSMPQREPKTKAFFKNRGRLSRKFDTGDMRILDDADLSVNDRVISVLGIADRMKHSLNLEKDKMTDDKDDVITSCTHPRKNRPLKPHNHENVEIRRKEGQTASQPIIKTTNHQTQSKYVNTAESDEDDKIISTPCLGEEIRCSVGDSIVRTTVLPPLTADSENETLQTSDTESYEDQPTEYRLQNVGIDTNNDLDDHQQSNTESCENQPTEYRLPNVGTDTNNDLEDQPRKLKITRLCSLDVEDFDEGFCITIILSPKSIPFPAPSDIKDVDKEIEDRQCLENTAEIDPDLRDLLCTESPPQNPDENRRFTSDDYRRALTVQDQYTCLFCGSNLEINPPDNFDFIPTSPFNIYDCLHNLDGNHVVLASPYDSNSNDLTMFCPLCCEDRLVQNYNWMKNC